MRSTRQMTSGVIKAPPLASLAVGDWLELFVYAASVHFLVLLSTGGMDLMTGLVLVRTVLSDVSFPVALPTFD